MNVQNKNKSWYVIIASPSFLSSGGLLEPSAKKQEGQSRLWLYGFPWMEYSTHFFFRQCLYEVLKPCSSLSGKSKMPVTVVIAQLSPVTTISHSSSGKNGAERNLAPRSIFTSAGLPTKFIGSQNRGQRENPFTGNNIVVSGSSPVITCAICSIRTLKPCRGFIGQQD